MGAAGHLYLPRKHAHHDLVPLVRFGKEGRDRTLPDAVPKVVGVEKNGGHGGPLDEESRRGGFPGAGRARHDEDGCLEVGD